MKRAILGLLVLAACGREVLTEAPPAAADAGQAVDAGELDGGAAGCTYLQLRACAAAEAYLATCCDPTYWAPVDAGELCGAIAETNSDPGAGCKKLTGETCAAINAQGWCL
jgi:hypothetical protein